MIFHFLKLRKEKAHYKTNSPLYYCHDGHVIGRVDDQEKTYEILYTSYNEYKRKTYLVWVQWLDGDNLNEVDTPMFKIGSIMMGHNGNAKNLVNVVDRYECLQVIIEMQERLGTLPPY